MLYWHTHSLNWQLLPNCFRSSANSPASSGSATVSAVAQKTTMAKKSHFSKLCSARAELPIFPSTFGYARTFGFNAGVKTMNKFTSLLAGVAALALSAGASEAADLERIVADPTYAATISGGVQFTWSDISADFDGPDTGELGDWTSPFGEAAVLWRPSGNFNVQSDFAFHSHRLDFADGKNGPDGNIAIDQWHAGGVAFWRDPTMGLFGIDGATGGIDIGHAGDVLRVGGRAEWFLGDMATIGGGVGYHNLDFGSGKIDIDGVNVNAFVNFYATEDLAIKVEFDYASLDFSSTNNCEGPCPDVDGDMWAVGGEVEYLLRDMFGGSSSLFVGGRYAEREFDISGDGTLTFEHAQVFVGFRSYFVTGGSLANHHRTNTLDNTNTLLEKVPFLAY